jgi:NAD(P)H dehydrogenase (quinone)
MRILVVYSHPAPTSFLASIHAELVRRLEADGHAVRVIDLYAEGFEPVLDPEAWRAHRRDEPAEAADLVPHIAALREAEGLIFVYPTWWYGMPAMLKGWLDRVWQPGVAFTLKDEVFQLHHLTDVRQFAVVTTCGSPGWFIERVVGDPARRQLMRGMALQLARGVRRCWSPIYDVDRRSQDDLAKARAKVVDRVARFMGRG